MDDCFLWRLAAAVDRRHRRYGRGRYAVRGASRADRPPAIALDGDAAVTYVSSRAIVPVRGVVKDDLAIHLVELRYLNSAHSEQDLRSEVVSSRPGPTAPSRVARFERRRANAGFGVRVGPGQADWFGAGRAAHLSRRGDRLQTAGGKERLAPRGRAGRPRVGRPHRPPAQRHSQPPGRGARQAARGALANHVARNPTGRNRRLCGPPISTTCKAPS